MKVKFWGVRGSIASPITGVEVRKKIEKILTLASVSDIQNEENIKKFLDTLGYSLLYTYGGNTTCLEIRDKNNELFIIDGGTGLRGLGNSLLNDDFRNGKGKANWLFTHTHWDHVQGIPFFVPLFIAGNKFDIYSPVDNLEDRLRYQHSSAHFPVEFEGFQADKKFHKLTEGESVKIGSMDVTSKAVRHPGGCFSYKLTENGKILIFASDAEFNLDEMENIDAYIQYFKGADVLIFDTQYTFEDSLQKIDWGHSSASMATDIALKAGVKKLVMFHHDPSYDDEKLDAVFMRALKYREMFDQDGQLEIIMAYEGLEIEI